MAILVLMYIINTYINVMFLRSFPVERRKGDRFGAPFATTEQCCGGGGATVLTHSPAVEFLCENWEQLQKHRFKTYTTALIFYFYLLHVQGCCS